MKTMRPTRLAFLAAPLLAITVALAMWVVATGSGTFNPTMTVQLSDYTAGANADITTTFDIPDGDLWYQAFYTGVPKEFFPPKDEVPIGALVGRIDSTFTVGLFGGSCTTGITPVFSLWKASLDDAPCTVKHSEQFADDDGDGLQNGIECWPEFLTRMLPAGAKPLERFYGDTQVGASPVSENIVTISASDAGLPSSWGLIQIAILNDIGDPERQAKPKEALTAFCTPLSSTTITFGLSQDNTRTPDVNESGFEVRRNPACAGTYTFHFRAISMRDADGDGIENYLDLCPFDPNGDIHLDPDGDGIDLSCDPDPNVFCGGTPFPNCAPSYEPFRATDCDCDGFWNRRDNCPLVPNGCNDTTCSNGTSFPMDPSWDEQADADGDYIGDACDTRGNGPNVPDGTPIVVDVNADVKITGPTCGGTPTPTPTATPKSTATVTVTTTATTTTTATATAPGVEDICPPVIPGTYNGLVRLNGVPAPSGWEIIAKVSGTEWGSAVVSGGRYAMDIPGHLVAVPPCFEPGGLTFQINGATCTATPASDTWASGLHDVNLTCAAAPTTTPTPAATTAPPSPTKTATATATATTTPAKPPYTGGGGLGGDQGLPPWAIVIAGWASLMALAGLAVGAWYARRRRAT